ncbi:MAG: substrate-binding domain-containing protein [Lachnospiraceae bacterium]|nr:substrate-binding domain-containing protein [Lachnospiraceae bacterium]
MLQCRKKIGIFLGQPDAAFQKQLLKAGGRAAFQNDYDVLVFSSLISNGGYPEYQAGEAKFMELVNFEALDAVIAVPDTLRLRPGFAEGIMDNIRNNFHGIKVAYDWEEEGFQSFLCGDAAGVHDVVAHLIEKHHCSDIVFVTGPEGHPHAEARLSGYRSALEEAGIEYDASKVYYGTFWYDSGETVVGQLLADGGKLPQAIACASDTMAVGVCRALQSRGLRAPEDIIVTGFDFEEPGANRAPFITSIEREIDCAAERAVRYIAEQLGGKPAGEAQALKPQPLLHCSCGCAPRPVHTFEDHENTENQFFEVYNFMQEMLIAAGNLNDCLWEIDGYADHIGKFERLFLCLSEDWKRLDLSESEEHVSERIILALNTAGGKNFKEENRVSLTRSFERSQMLPALWEEREKPAMFFFSLLHFGTHCFGYTVLEYTGKECVYDRRFPFWQRNVNNALESLRRVYAVNELYEAAEHKAVTDAMTGLYNRNGYNLMFPGLAEELGEGERLLFMLCDNNSLKYINDTYGHLAGDEVIRLSAHILAKKYFDASVRELNFRIGGDEYVKLAVGRFTDEEAEQCVSGIRRRVEAENARRRNSALIDLAIGYCVYERGTMGSLDQMMTEVDARMYRNKQEMKAAFGFAPTRGRNS